jgi:hypothetical protein
MGPVALPSLRSLWTVPPVERVAEIFRELRDLGYVVDETLVDPFEPQWMREARTREETVLTPVTSLGPKLTIYYVRRASGDIKIGRTKQFAARL